jgi:CO dehydrogenase/acetyl-CoA synthase delta subunit
MISPIHPHGNPDRLAQLATLASLRGDTELAFTLTTRSIRARADWVLVNGKWTPRKGVMR